MLQRDPPLSFFLGGGWLKYRWLKTPGKPARNYSQQGTVEHQQMSHRLVTAFDSKQCHIVVFQVEAFALQVFASLQPFEHKLCDAQPCRFWRAALSSPDVAP
eukprot:3580111-Amphidinium_carterae.1